MVTRGFCAIWRSGYDQSPLSQTRRQVRFHTHHVGHRARTPRRIGDAPGTGLPFAGTPSPITPVRFSSAVMPMSTISEPPSNKVDNCQAIRPILFISRATIEYERHRTLLDLEAGSTVWSIKRIHSRLFPRGTTFTHCFRPQGTRKRKHSPRVRRGGWNFLAAYKFGLEYFKVSAHGNANFLSRLPMPAMERGRRGCRHLTPSDEIRYFPSFFRSHSLFLGRSSTRCGRVEVCWRPPTRPPACVGYHSPSAFYFAIFRPHGLRIMVLTYPDAPSGESAAGASSHVALPGSNWPFTFPANTFPGDSLAASAFCSLPPHPRQTQLMSPASVKVLFVSSEPTLNHWPAYMQFTLTFFINLDTRRSLMPADISDEGTRE